MRLPLSVLPAFCAGIIIAFNLTCPPSYWVLVLVMLACLFSTKYFTIFKHIAFFILGLGYSIFRIESALENRLPLDQNGTQYTLKIIVEDIPKQEDYGTVFTAKVVNPEHNIPHKIILTDYGKGVWPSGSLWEIKTKLKTPVGSVNWAGFKRESYYFEKGIGAIGSVQKDKKYLGLSSRLKSILDRFRSKVAHRIHSVGNAHPKGAILISALTIGEQSALTQEDWQAFRKTGITHLISISGLHITMVALLAGFLAKYITCKLKIKRIQPRTIMLSFGVSVGFIYAILAGFSVPTQRSIFMLFFVVLLILNQKFFTSWQIWWMALSAVLIISPLAVLSLGFWLSFGLVAALLWISTNRKRNTQPKWILAIKAQLSTTVASVVPLGFFFGQFPVLSPIINFLAIPWVSWVITPLALIALCIPFDLPLQFICMLAEYSLLALEKMLPFAYELTITKSPLPLFLLGLVGTLLILAPKGFPMKPLGLASILLVLLYQPNKLQENEAIITVLDVGQGSSMLVQTQNHSMLFDTGLGSADWTVLPNLRANGVTNLDMLVLSHNDTDHDSGLKQITLTYPEITIYAGQPKNYSTNKKITHCNGKENWLWDGVLFEWFTLEPFSNNSNDTICVLKITTQSQSLLITGDLSKNGERQLISKYKEKLASQILILGHHGSKTATDKKFLAAVQPKYAIASSGFANRFKHPNQQVIENLAQHNITLFRTDLQGAIRIHMNQQISIAPQIKHKPFWQIKPILFP